MTECIHPRCILGRDIDDYYHLNSCIFFEDNGLWITEANINAIPKYYAKYLLKKLSEHFGGCSEFTIHGEGHPYDECGDRGW